MYEKLEKEVDQAVKTYKREISADIGCLRERDKGFEEGAEMALRVARRMDRNPWYTESWHDEDIMFAMQEAGVDATPDSFKKAKQAVKGIFDDKTERNEALKQCIENAFK